MIARSPFKPQRTGAEYDRLVLLRSAVANILLSGQKGMETETSSNPHRSSLDSCFQELMPVIRPEEKFCLVLSRLAEIETDATIQSEKRVTKFVIVLACDDKLD